MWNLKKQKNKLIDTEDKLVVASGRGVEVVRKRVKGVKRYKLTVIK